MSTNPNLMTDEEIQGEIEAMKNKVAKLENILNARKEEEKKIAWAKVANAIDDYVVKYGNVKIKTCYGMVYDLHAYHANAGEFSCSD